MANYRQTFAPRWPSARQENTPFDALAVDPNNADSSVAGAEGIRISDLPFPYPSSDHHRIANAVWLLENNPSGRAPLPAMADDETDAPRFAAVAPSSSSGLAADQILSRMALNDLPRPDADTAAPQIGPSLAGDSSAPTASAQTDGKKPGALPARTKVSLFYRPIHGTTSMHSYVVVEGDGERFYAGAFPERDLGFASNVGQAAMDGVGVKSDLRGSLI